MKFFPLIAVILAMRTSAIAEDVPPMILAREPVRVWRGPSFYEVVYADGRREMWWGAASNRLQVNGVNYYADSWGYSGPAGERYRMIGSHWQRSGPNSLMIRRESSSSYSVGTSRYIEVANGWQRVSAYSAPSRSTNTAARMKNVRPIKFRSGR